MTVVLGLTGGIASGKSTVSTMIRKRGIRVIDADIISREVVEVGKPAYHQIVELFGEDILHDNDTINREKLGALIFGDEKKRNQLNRIVHPAVREEIFEQTKEEKEKSAKAVVLDIPLLFESKLTHLVDKTILVYVDEKTQLERLMKRNGFSEDEAMMRIRSQLPLKEKIILSDELINNNGSIEETEIQLHEILSKLM
ncbi:MULTISPECIES: dephospho-CoA kinase [Metabacillus]|uniref:Dephospho-CoA kinase n=1 Tax=Metabacillus rhizolycopersici TaxID=2875709 RepID=A0ABS7UQG3_9BACI|nr:MULTISPECIES: dephospho-CoA kinase [Metabacillus]MBZ5750190.1 dephospho-CoA kinase [Metabacillus rhizolycopersici]MCM3650707.1 dephospho-CoA kinase [Metabacillus litoralis]